MEADYRYIICTAEAIVGDHCYAGITGLLHSLSADTAKCFADTNGNETYASLLADEPVCAIPPVMCCSPSADGMECPR